MRLRVSLFVIAIVMVAMGMCCSLTQGNHEEHRNLFCRTCCRVTDDRQTCRLLTGDEIEAMGQEVCQRAFNKHKRSQRMEPGMSDSAAPDYYNGDSDEQVPYEQHHRSITDNANGDVQFPPTRRCATDCVVPIGAPAGAPYFSKKIREAVDRIMEIAKSDGIPREIFGLIATSDYWASAMEEEKALRRK